MSVSSSGALSNGPSIDAAVSANGRFVAFESKGSNLVAGDSNGTNDIFVRDTLNNKTYRVSVASNGAQANGQSIDPSISHDGSIVAFTSRASNLVNGNSRESRAYRGPGISVYAHDRATGRTELISVSTSGVPSDRHAWLPDVSPDGGFVAFSSHSDKLVPPDMNRIKRDAFVRDRVNGITSYAGVLSNGENPWSGSSYPVMAADGRYVAFQSLAGNLVPGDTNIEFDIFVYDRQQNKTTRVSVGTNGSQGQHKAKDADITPDGRFVVFATVSDLAPEDRNGRSDVYLHDRTTGKTMLVSVSSSGNLGGGDSTKPSISADGRYISFLSLASNLVNNDNNGQQDVFIHDRQTGRTILVSVDLQGTAGNGRTSFQELSADGRVVVFVSSANDLVANDNNNKPDAFMSVIGWGP